MLVAFPMSPAPLPRLWPRRRTWRSESPHWRSATWLLSVRPRPFMTSMTNWRVSWPARSPCTVRYLLLKGCGGSVPNSGAWVLWRPTLGGPRAPGVLQVTVGSREPGVFLVPFLSRHFAEAGGAVGAAAPPPDCAPAALASVRRRRDTCRSCWRWPSRSCSRPCGGRRRCQRWRPSWLRGSRPSPRRVARPGGLHVPTTGSPPVPVSWKRAVLAHEPPTQGEKETSTLSIRPKGLCASMAALGLWGWHLQPA